MLCLSIEFRRNSSFIVLWLGLGLIFYFPLLMDLIFQNKIYLSSTYKSVAFFSILFNCIYFFTRLFFGKKNNYSLIFDNGKINLYFLRVCSCFLFFSVMGVIGYYLISGISILNVTWSDKQDLGPFMGLMVYFYYFGCISVFLSFLMKNRKYLFFSVILILVFILLTQSRAIIIPAIAPFLIYMILYKKQWIRFLLFSIFAIFTFFVLQQIRYAGGVSDFFSTDASIILKNTMDKILAEDNEFSLINSFYKIVESPQELTRYGEFSTFIRMIMVAYPDPLNTYYSIKPSDFTYDIYTHYYGYYQGTFHPTFYGLIYANSGFYFGLVSAVFFGLIVSFYDRVFNYLNLRRIYLVYFSVVVSCCHMSVLWARGSIYNGWSQGLFMSITSLVIFLILKQVLKK